MNFKVLPSYIGGSLVLAVTASFLVSCATKNRQPLPTVAGVDLKRYAGHWHEVARLPNFFQQDDAKAVAEYTLNPDGSVKVVNTELRPDGSSKKVEGTATAVPGSNNARLRVKFKGWASLAPVSGEGNYWIIKLAEDYSMALVGTPDRKYLWLLSRDANASEMDKKAFLNEANRLGFDESKVIHGSRH